MLEALIIPEFVTDFPNIFLAFPDNIDNFRFLLMVDTPFMEFLDLKKYSRRHMQIMSFECLYGRENSNYISIPILILGA